MASAVMTRSQAYDRKADEAEAMALVAHTVETRQAMRELARRWRVLAAEEGRGLHASSAPEPIRDESRA
jgi:hypothetical protein